MDLTTPDSPTARAAEAFVTEVSPAFLNGHVYRTFHFGRALTDSHDYDLEVAWVASLFHDLALLERFAADCPFELAGADHAARFLERRGWDQDRIRLVADAICHHADLDPIGGPEYRFVHLGAALDVAGLRLDEVDPVMVDIVLAAHPRDGLAEHLTPLVHSEIAAHPDGAFARLNALFPMADLIAANPLNASC